MANAPVHSRRLGQSPGTSPGARRGFTLLEVVLATVISATVAGVCLGLFLFFDRSDSRLQDRFVQNDQLTRLHLVSERAFQRLLIADKPTVLKDAEQKILSGTNAADSSKGPVFDIDEALRRANAAERKGPRGSMGTESTNQGTPSTRTAGTPRDNRRELRNHPEIVAIRELIPPRLALSLLPEARVDAPTQRDAEGGLSALRAERFTTTPQRLEVVLTESPVPSSSVLDDPQALLQRVEKQRARERRELRRNLAPGEGTGSSPALEGEDAAADEDFESPLRALRGAFEMRPIIATSRRGEPVSGEVRGWEVWWVPLPPQAGPDEEVDTEAPLLDSPFLVASDIAFIEWKVFQGRERRTEYAARLNEDIPAYIEMEVETTGGLRANWLFELDWTYGHEARAIAPPAPAIAATNGNGTGNPAQNPSGGPATTPVTGKPGEVPSQPVATLPGSPTPRPTPTQKPGRRIEVPSDDKPGQSVPFTPLTPARKKPRGGG